MNPALLITNPTAGRRRPEAAPERLLAALDAHGVDADLLCTAKRGDAEEAARRAGEEGRELIVVAGGDGTLNEVAHGLMGCRLPVCLVPCGTENVVARELGIPFAVDDACALAADGLPRPIDAGLCNDRAFLLAAGVGFDAAIVRGVSLRLKRWLGEGAYWVAGLRELVRARPIPFDLALDGSARAVRCYGIIASNTSSYAGRPRVFPNASVDNGLLDLNLLHARGYLRFLRAVLRLLRGSAPPAADVEAVSVRELEVRAPGPVPVQLDGDDFCDTPVSVRVVPGGLTLLVPP